MITRPARVEAPRGATVIASLTNGSPWTRSLPSKVPAVSLPFWILTILCTTAGATAADALSANLGLGPGLGMSATTAIMGLLVAGSLIWQLSTARYVPVSYWLTVFLAVVLATIVSDDLVDNPGVSLWAATGIFGAALAVAFTGWWCSEHTVSVHNVLTRRREAWYWFVVLCAFSLGSSVEALMSEGLGLGYAPAGFVFAFVMGVVAVARLGLKLDVVGAFWAAYILTRPVGAAVGDFLTATPEHGGVGLGANATSVVLLAFILVVGSLVRAGAHRSHGATRDAAS
jgi:uncharacterized membrane-anchored protein